MTETNPHVEMMESFKAHVPEGVQKAYLAHVTANPGMSHEQLAAGIEALTAAYKPAPQLQQEAALAYLAAKEPEPSVSTQIAHAERIAHEAAAKGENVSAVTAKVAEVGTGAAHSANVAQVAVKQNEEKVALVENTNTKAMHDETVAKASGQAAPSQFDGMVSKDLLLQIASAMGGNGAAIQIAKERGGAEAARI